MNKTEKKQRNVRAVVEHRRRKKMELIAYKGGKCEACGYGKLIPGAYHFHHIDPKEKEFGISSRLSRNIDILKKEADKCKLLCATCHAEEHENEYSESREKTIESWENLTWDEWKKREANRKSPKRKITICKGCKCEFNPNFTRQLYCNRECIRKSKSFETGSCEICNKEYEKNSASQKYCSIKCSSKSRCKCSRPSKDRLVELLETNSWTSLGLLYGVSDNAVRKWARKYGLL